MKKIQVKLKVHPDKVKPHSDTRLLQTFDYTQFNTLADIILNNTLLIVKDKRYRICEIEFYYQSDQHNDQYSHGSEEQHMLGKFYFHKYKNGTYKSGTYKGLDITVSPNSSVCFGILIRSIQDQDTMQFIEGPCKSVNQMLELFGCQTVNQFVLGKTLPLDIYDTNNQFYLTHTCSLSNESIYMGPRIGLSDKYPDFQSRWYRYAILTHNIKKKRPNNAL